MKFVKLFLDYFFGLGAALVVVDLILFRGAIEEMTSLPEPLKYMVGISIALYWVSRTAWFVYSKFWLEAKERLLEIRRKEQEILG